MQRVAVRIWLPDNPGVLGAVATRIGGIDGNVVGLEVLEREGGVAVDELMIELPDTALIDRMCAEVRQIDGVGVEDVRPVSAEAEERGLQVMAAAVSILETVNSTAALTALMGHTGELFDAEWATLVDLDAQSYVKSFGVVPQVTWLAAFVAGARTTTGEGGATAGSGVLAEELREPGLTLCVGRSVPFRRRERREIEMLVRICDRVWAALEPGPVPHPTW